MTFDKLHLDTHCDCTSNAVTDLDGYYIRKIRATEITDKDFISHWERNIGHEYADCDSICNYKAISINLFSEDTIEKLVSHYTTTFNINPKKGSYYIRFRLGEDSGSVKHAPLEDDETHFNLFKADEFDINGLEIVETVKFA